VDCVVDAGGGSLWCAADGAAVGSSEAEFLVEEVLVIVAVRGKAVFLVVRDSVSAVCVGVAVCIAVVRFNETLVSKGCHTVLEVVNEAGLARVLAEVVADSMVEVVGCLRAVLYPIMYATAHSVPFGSRTNVSVMHSWHAVG